jgi:hypothetical protein
MTLARNRGYAEALRVLSKVNATSLDSRMCFVLLTAPSLRSNRPSAAAFDDLRQGRCAGEAQDPWDGENIMVVLLDYFIDAAMAGVAASAIVGFVLTSLLVARVDKSDRPARVTYLITSFRLNR